MRNRRDNRRKRRKRFTEGDDVNPMNYVSNLSDVMLILAVGIMLALILRGEVEVRTAADNSSDTGTESAIEFSENDLQNLDDVPEDMEHMGEVFYDAETGKYYIIQNNE